MDIHNAEKRNDEEEKRRILHSRTLVMSTHDLGSLYDYNYEDQDDDVEPYLYLPVDGNGELAEDQRTEDTEEASLPHRLEDTLYPTNESVPFYADTTNKSTYTWKVPNRQERRVIATTDTNQVEKIPFYSETTHKSQYVPFNASVERTRLSRKSDNLPTANQPIEMETTYRNLFQELEIGKRQKLIHTCPAEKLIHQKAILRKSRRENGHFFLPVETIEKTVQPSPLSKKPAQQ